MPMSLHMAKLLTDWGEITLFTNEVLQLDEETKKTFAKKKIVIEEPQIARVKEAANGMNSVVFTDGDEIRVKVIFVATSFRMAFPIAQDLGCAFTESPRGPTIKTDETKMTSVPGVYAAEDMARLGHSVSLAAADGSLAGAACHQSLIEEEFGK